MTDNKNTSLAKYEQEVVSDLAKSEHHRVENYGDRRLIPTQIRMLIDIEGNVTKLTAADGSVLENEDVQKLLGTGLSSDTSFDEEYLLMLESPEDFTDEIDPAILEDVKKDVAEDIQAFRSESLAIQEQEAAFLASYEGVVIHMISRKDSLELTIRESEDQVSYQLTFESDPVMRKRFDMSLRRLHETNVQATIRSWASLPYGKMIGYKAGDASGLSESSFMVETKPASSKFDPAQILALVYQTPLLHLARLVDGEYRVEAPKITEEIQRRMQYLAVETDYQPPKRVDLTPEATRMIKDNLSASKLLSLRESGDHT